jgi:hypothetical protein
VDIRGRLVAPVALPPPERTASASGKPKGRFGPQSVNALQFAMQILQFGRTLGNHGGVGKMPYNVPGCMNVGGAADSGGSSYGATDGPTGLIRSEMSEKSSWGMVKSPRRNGSPQWLGSLTKES